MIRHRESALDGAIECKVRILLSLGREFLSGNVRVLEIDIPSGENGHVQA